MTFLYEQIWPYICGHFHPHHSHSHLPTSNAFIIFEISCSKKTVVKNILSYCAKLVVYVGSVIYNSVQ